MSRKNKAAGYVLDASAVLALFHGEPGADIVESALSLESTCISTVQIAEVAAKLIARGLTIAEVAEIFDCFTVPRIALNEMVALNSGFMYKATRMAGLSLGDRICLSLGKILHLPILTADKVWKALDIGVEVQLIR